MLTVVMRIRVEIWAFGVGIGGMASLLLLRRASRRVAEPRTALPRRPQEGFVVR